ncbi:CidA/LrgA family protein [Diaphorobacter caeni]|uniref:CidA/LrgA family protein n=1 Tax=Diaphorobacter caeni TaxID=2784387 RepID=UPI002B279694|nr:CidA/LrgA family protein [Diaphorobacter caeni]
MRFQLAGDFLVRALGLPVPGSLIGLVGLTLVLLVLGRVPAALGKVSGGLLRNMMLMLAPAVVGLIDNFGRVREEWLPFLVAGVVGSVITLAVTAVTLQYLLRRSDTASVADPAEGSKA